VQGHIGDDETVRDQARTLLALQPSFTISGSAKPLAVFRIAAHADYLLDGLRKSGLPE
jgi:hypothetical protein